MSGLEPLLITIMTNQTSSHSELNHLHDDAILSFGTRRAALVFVEESQLPVMNMKGSGEVEMLMEKPHRELMAPFLFSRMKRTASSGAMPASINDTATITGAL